MFDAIIWIIIAVCFYFVGSISSTEETQHAIWDDCFNEQKFVIRDVTFQCHYIPGSGGGEHVEFTK